MSYKYWAFLSYSHQDNLHQRADGSKGNIRWAEWLHTSLETWKVPAEFRARATRTGEPMPENFFPVFQDEKELPLNSDLANSIQTALDESRFLIVICSPRSARSFYVNEEVRHFKHIGRQDRILALIVDGEPNATDGTKAGISADRECFCPALRYALDADGAILEGVRDPQEPIAGDVRLKSGELPREAHERDMRVHREVIDFMKLKLIAGLMGVGFDELAQREKVRAAAQARARVRRLAVLTGAFAVIGVVAVIAAILAFYSRNAAVAAQAVAVAAEQKAEAETVIANQQTDLAKTREKEVRARLANLYEEKGRQALTAGDPASAAPYLVEAWKTYPERAELQLLVGMALQPLEGHRLILNGHPTEVMKVCWSPDGKFIASADGTGGVRLWNAVDGTPVTHFQMDDANGFGRTILSFFFTPGSDQLIATNDHGNISLLNLARPTDPPAKLGHSFYSVDAALSSDGKLLATAGMGAMNTPGQEVNIWQLPAGTNLGTFGDGEGKSACFSRDGKLVLIASADGAVRVWDWAAKKVTLELKGDGPITKALFIQDDKSIVATGPQNLLEWWDAASGAVTLNLKPSDLAPNLTTLEVSSDGHQLFAAELTKASITDLQAQPILTRSLLMPANVLVNNARLSPDAKWVVTCPYSGKNTAVWDTATGKQVAPLVGQQGNIYDGAFSPDGKQVAVAGADHRVVVWDWPKVVIPPPLPDQEFPVLRARFGAPDRVVTEISAKLRLWSLSDAKLITEIQHPSDPAPGNISYIQQWAVSRDGLHLATIGGDKTIRLYDGRTGQAGPVLPLEQRGSVIDFSPDGSLLSSGDVSGAVRLWDVAAGTQKAILSRKFHNLNQATFDPSGTKLLLLGGNDPATVWDVASNQSHAVLNAGNVEQEIGAFSPDGSRVFTFGHDHLLRAWNADTGALLATRGPFVNGDRNSLLTFSDDGKILAVFSGGGTVFFFDGTTGDPLGQWDTPSHDDVSSFQFWPNSHYLALTVYQTIDFYDPDSSQLLASYPGAGTLKNLHFNPDGSGVLVSQEKTARFIPLFHPLKNVAAAVAEVDRLDRWKLVDGRLVPK